MQQIKQVHSDAADKMQKNRRMRKFIRLFFIAFV